MEELLLKRRIVSIDDMDRFEKKYEVERDLLKAVGTIV